MFTWETPVLKYMWRSQARELELPGTSSVLCLCWGGISLEEFHAGFQSMLISLKEKKGWACNIVNLILFQTVRDVIAQIQLQDFLIRWDKQMQLEFILFLLQFLWSNKRFEGSGWWKRIDAAYICSKIKLSYHDISSCWSRCYFICCVIVANRLELCCIFFIFTESIEFERNSKTTSEYYFLKEDFHRKEKNWKLEDRFWYMLVRSLNILPLLSKAKLDINIKCGKKANQLSLLNDHSQGHWKYRWIESFSA